MDPLRRICALICSKLIALAADEPSKRCLRSCSGLLGFLDFSIAGKISDGEDVVKFPGDVVIGWCQLSGVSLG